MAMLAEKKKREKWCINPRGNAWSNDQSKFGQRLLEKMGWSAGQGLGVNKQGPTEIVKVRKKDDSKGLGFKENGEEWLKTTSEFNELLDQLGNSVENGETPSEVATSLEDRSKKSKARVHYHKFTRGKDLSRYSEKDLASIIGPEIVKFKSNEEGENPNYTSNQINKGSSEEYFNSKKKSNQHQLSEQDDPVKIRSHDHEEDITPTNKKCKKSKKSKEHDEFFVPSLEVSSKRVKDLKSIINGTREENPANEFQECFDNVEIEENNKTRSYKDCNKQVDVSIKKSKKSKHANDRNAINEDEGGDINVFDKRYEEQLTTNSNQLLASPYKKNKKRKSSNIEVSNEYTQNKTEGDDYISLNVEKKVGTNVDSDVSSKKKKKKRSTNNERDNEYSSTLIGENNCLNNEMKEEANVRLNDEPKILSKKKKIIKSVNDNENIISEMEDNADYVDKEEKKNKKRGKNNENKVERDVYNSLDVKNKGVVNIGLNDDSKFSSKEKKKKNKNDGVYNAKNTSSPIEGNNFVDKETKEQSKVGLIEESDVTSNKNKNSKSVNDIDNKIGEIEESSDYVGKEHKKENKKRKMCKIVESITNDIETNTEMLKGVTLFENESTKENKKKKKKLILEEKESLLHLEMVKPVEQLKPTHKQSKLEKKLKNSKVSEEANDDILHPITLEEQIQESWISKMEMKKEKKLTQKESGNVQNYETAVLNKEVKTPQESNKECLEVLGRRTRLRKINKPLIRPQNTNYETADFMTLSTTGSKSQSNFVTDQNETETSKLNLTRIHGRLNPEDQKVPKHVVAYEYRLLSNKMKEYNLVVPECKIVVKNSETVTAMQHRKLKQLYKSRHIKTLLPKQDVKEIERAVKRFADELQPKIDIFDNLMKIEDQIAQLVQDLTEESGSRSSTGIKMGSTFVLNSKQLETLENVSKELMLLSTKKVNDPPAKNHLGRKEKDDVAPAVVKSTEKRVAPGENDKQEAEEENIQFKHPLQTRIQEKCKLIMEQIKMLREGKKPPSLDLKERGGENTTMPFIKPAEKPTHNQAGENEFNNHQYSFRGRGRGGVRGGPRVRGSFTQPTFPSGHGAHNSIPYGGWGILKSYNRGCGQGTFCSRGGFEGSKESMGERTFGFQGGFIGNNSFGQGTYDFRGGFNGNNSFGQGTYGFRGGFEGSKESMGQRTFGFQGAFVDNNSYGRGTYGFRGNNNTYGRGTYGFRGGFRGAPDGFRGRGRGQPRERGRISKNNFDAKRYAEKCKELKTVPELTFKGVDLTKIIPGYAASKENEDSNHISNLKAPVDSVKLNKLPETSVGKYNSESIRKKEPVETPNSIKHFSSNPGKTLGALLDVVVQKEKR